MCHKNETQFKILSLKSSHLSKFHQNPLTLHMPRNITAAQKHAQDFSENDVLAQTNQISYDSFFFLILLWKNSEKNNLVKLELLKEIFLSPEYRFWIQISEIW